MMAAPFRVYKRGGHWWLTGRYWPQNASRYRFDTPAEAVTYAYKQWPWWP